MDGIIIALIAAASASIVAPVVNFVLQRFNNKGALSQGMRALLWREIKTIHHDAMEKGGMTIDDREHLENVYTAYHAIGGNGTGTKLYDEAMRLPTIC